MSQSYTVKQGDTLISIAGANDYGSWEAIWNHERNAPLRKKRPDPQVLAAGDIVFIPDKTPLSVALTPGTPHTVIIKSLKAAFRTTVLDDQGKPLANCRYVLTLEGKTLEGKTDASGVVTQNIDPKPMMGKLEVFVGKPEVKLTFNLKLGNLDPVDKTTGVKARLNNLGFNCGRVDDRINAATIAALRSFQIVHRLPVTGEIDDATRARLLQAHDRR